ncbi:MAG: Holliday junction resolvase [Methanobacteriota archaeon]|nr:MAG: Holliday junction resolvase [Euryarchaeota archaeon]
MAGSDYERELKRILHGDLDIINKVTRTCDDNEKEHYLKIIDKPFVVSRAAGSMGFDLIALRGDVSFPIEVKTSSRKTIRFSDASGRASDQARWMIRECDRAGLFPVYAYRLKGQRGDSWRVFAMEVEGVKGRLGVMYKRLPKVEKSAVGHYVLRWEDGMQLNKFIDYLCR